MATVTTPKNQDYEPVPCLRPGTVTTVSVTNTSAASAAITGDVVELTCDQDMYIQFGSSPTATSSTTPLWQNDTKTYRIVSGEKIAAIRDSADGTLWITVLS